MEKYILGKPVLIETLWNVKVVAAVLPYINGLVLIETLWNVKKEQQKAAQDMTLVLIETLWNVKVLIQLSIYKIRSVVLIETLWNLKFLTQHLSRLGRVRINRNIVECKEHIPRLR